MGNTVVTLSGDDANLFKAYQRIIAQQAKIDAGLKGVGDQAKKAKTGVDALAATDFDDLNASLDDISNVKFDFDIGNALVTAASVGKAIEMATAAWELYSKARDDALRSQEGLSDPNRRLAQIATDADDLSNMQQRADAASIATGVSRDVAREVLFSAMSEGFADEFEDLLNFNQVVDPRSSAVVAGQVPALFGGQIKPLESVSLIEAVAKKSRLNFEQMATSMPAASEGAAILGATPEETASALSVLASRFKSGETAADRLKAFGVAAGLDDRFKGKGFIETVSILESMPEDDRKDFLGKGAELNVAYETLKQDKGIITARTSEMQAERAAFAAGGGAIRDQQAIVTENPSANNLRRVEIAKNQAEVARERQLGKAGAEASITSSKTNMLLDSRDNATLIDYVAVEGARNVIDRVNSFFNLGISPENQALASNIYSEVSNPISMISNFGRSGTANAVRDSAKTMSVENELLQEMKTQNELIRKQNELLSTQTTPPPPNPALINQQQSLRGQ
jgi:hypothetical protein